MKYPIAFILMSNTSVIIIIIIIIIIIVVVTEVFDMTMKAIGYFSIIIPAYREDQQHSHYTHQTVQTVHTATS